MSGCRANAMPTGARGQVLDRPGSIGRNCNLTIAGSTQFLIGPGADEGSGSANKKIGSGGISKYLPTLFSTLFSQSLPQRSHRRAGKPRFPCRPRDSHRSPPQQLRADGIADPAEAARAQCVLMVRTHLTAIREPRLMVLTFTTDMPSLRVRAADSTENAWVALHGYAFRTFPSTCRPRRTL